MKSFRKILSTILLLIAALCIFAGLVLAAGYVLQMQQNEQLVDSLRPNISLETKETETSSPSEAPQSDSSDASESHASSETDSETADNVSTETATDDSVSAETEKSPEAKDRAEDPSTETPATESSTEEPSAVPNPYADSFLANPDMAAWLTIPGTNIDYPVMWTPEDENYYLYRDFNGKDNQNGCLILDTDSCLDPLTTNQIIHGHNMKSGAMFGNLTDYESKDYWEKHKLITLHTKQCQRNYEVIAVFRSQVYKKTDEVFKFYKFFQADTEEEFNDFYENIKSLSIYDTGVTAEFGDHFLTLSTCVYHVKNGRFVVVAKETTPGASYLPAE